MEQFSPYLGCVKDSCRELFVHTHSIQWYKHTCTDLELHEGCESGIHCTLYRPQMVHKFNCTHYLNPMPMDLCDETFFFFAVPSAL